VGKENYGDSLILFENKVITATENGKWLGPGVCGALRTAHELVFLLDVTAAATDAGDILAVKIQEGLPGSLAIVPNDVIRFPDVLGTGGAVRFIAKLHTNPGRGLDAGLILTTPAPSVAMVANTVTHGPLSDLIRFVITFTDAGTVNASFTASLKAYVKG